MRGEARRYHPGLDYQGIESNASSFANPKDIAGMLFHVKFSILTENVLKPCDFFPHFFQRHAWIPVALKFGPVF
jgi:hypothetical protein